MYYVNKEQIERRLNAIPDIAEGLHIAAESWDNGLLLGLVQERSLHLAIEVVTDVCSYLIDGFIMRDASSYEDIVQITYEENVFDDNIYQVLIQLVKLRKPLVQDYCDWDRRSIHPLTAVLPDILNRFTDSTRRYLENEWVPER
ncbi:uncharacterized protein YutE (UPF0331/DUF86 family) [Paenibacillus sp. DS2015]|uniref:DUF86 domain-containing protein n=1 Tax=Paenibacillus sp. DS2015 TaxID=3373917 RepID=UPI003D1C7908